MFCNLSFWETDRPVWEQHDLFDSPALCSVTSGCYVTVAITPAWNFRRSFSLHVYILSRSPKHNVIAASWTPAVTNSPNNGLHSCENFPLLQNKAYRRVTMKLKKRDHFADTLEDIIINNLTTIVIHTTYNILLFTDFYDDMFRSLYDHLRFVKTRRIS
jgi:hypothetical protein